MVMECPSLFALVDNFEYMEYGYYSILQLISDTSPEGIRMIKLDEMVRFRLPKERRIIYWLFSPPEGSSEDLYMVPNWRFTEGDTVKPLHGYKFSFRDGSFLPISLPKYYNEKAFVVSLRGIFYLMSYDDSDDWSSQRRKTDFQCYDPVKDSWKPLEPFPYEAIQAHYIPATAVWDDTILLIGGFSPGIWAYDVNGNKWYPIKFEDTRCEHIVRRIVKGGAVVVGNFIYAVTNSLVVVLSIEKKSIGKRFVFKCSLVSDNRMNPFFFEDQVDMSSRHFVHLGKDMFCVVEGCHLFEGDCRPIQVTYTKFKYDKSLMVITKHFQSVKIQPRGSSGYTDEFCVRLCFSLPVTTALEKGKSFILDSCPKEEEIFNISELFRDSDSSQTNIIDEPLGGPHEQVNESAVGSSSFGKSKLKNHGKGSRSKTTCARHNGGWCFYQPFRPKGKKRPNKVAGSEKKLPKNGKTKKEWLAFLEEVSRAEFENQMKMKRIMRMQLAFFEEEEETLQDAEEFSRLFKYGLMMLMKQCQAYLEEWIETMHLALESQVSGLVKDGKERVKERVSFRRKKKPCTSFGTV